MDCLGTRPETGLDPQVTRLDGDFTSYSISQTRLQRTLLGLYGRSTTVVCHCCVYRLQFSVYFVSCELAFNTRIQSKGGQVSSERN